MFIADPEITSQYITTGHSHLKSPLETAFLNKFLGDKNMVSVEGAEWKSLRSVFNPGFAASHLMTLSGYIVDASLEFCDVMREKAESNELFELEEYTTRLTIDIIGKVVLDSDFKSQKSNHPIVDAFRQRVNIMPQASGPFDIGPMDLIRPLLLWWNGGKLDRLLGEELDMKLAARLSGNENNAAKAFKDRKRSVIDLALDAYQKEMAENASEKGKPTTNAQMRAGFRRQAIDSIKTFIFAGHDTTSSTIAYLLYLLHLRPQVHKKAVAELDSIFGTGCSTTDIAEAIKAEPHIINRLEYCTAVIKEVLRVFPPASTLRHISTEADPNKTFYVVDPKTGIKCPLAGAHVWPPMHLIGRNEAFFPQPADFIPERFIPSQTPFPEAKLFTPAGKDAWRPFEKGPRNCIGQELAMIESKIILALVVKTFDFVAEFDGKKLEKWTPIETAEEFADNIDGAKRLTVEGHRCYQILKGSAKPVDGMPGRIYLRKGAN